LPYDIYDTLKWNIVVSSNGDCFDRYLLRIYEMRESLQLIMQVINMLPKGQVFNTDKKIFSVSKTSMRYSMESLIHHFKFYTEGVSLPKNYLYLAVEAPKGEFGIFISSDGSAKPYRCKIKSPGFFHLQGLNIMAVNHLIADV